MFLLCPGHFQWGGVGGGGGNIVSPLSICTSVPYVTQMVCNTNGFRAISFERIGVLD